MPKFLRCPKDGQHLTFKGSQRGCVDSAITLDANISVTARELGAILYDITEPDDHEIVCATCGALVWPSRRAITFVPGEGMVLLCDFSTGFQPPEMVKVRPVLVLSPRARNRQTCLVVPISTVAPRDPKLAGAAFVPLSPRKYPFLHAESWAKCETVSTVSLARLFWLRDPQTGRGLDSRTTMLDAGDLERARRGVGAAVGLPEVDV
jgi:uncharacterized protein YifN (PemK superfamily)